MSEYLSNIIEARAAIPPRLEQAVKVYVWLWWPKGHCGRVPFRYFGVSQPLMCETSLTNSHVGTIGRAQCEFSLY
jgi:hypothetical protein